MLNHQILVGILLPFLGTCLGAALAFFMRSEMNNSIQRCLTSFAAGAMIYVVVEELIPEMSAGKHSNLGTLAFALGFTLMMTLDIALG